MLTDAKPETGVAIARWPAPVLCSVPRPSSPFSGREMVMPVKAVEEMNGFAPTSVTSQLLELENMPVAVPKLMPESVRPSTFWLSVLFSNSVAVIVATPPSFATVS